MVPLMYCLTSKQLSLQWVTAEYLLIQFIYCFHGGNIMARLRAQSQKTTFPLLMFLPPDVADLL